MDQYQSVEVILHNMDDTQLFAMEIPGGNHKLPNIILINATIAKLMDTGVYTKLIEK